MLLEGPGIKPRMAFRGVSLLDLGPTILSVFGVDTPGYFMGASLVPFMRGEDPLLSRPLVVDTSRGIRAMLFEDRYKAIVDLRHGTEELYDLRKDPRERRNLAERADSREYFETLYAFFAGLNPPAATAKR
jgi:arylsulfatase A-like enzyme